MTIPLSSVFTGWTGSLIPTAVDDLKRGIEVECERFRDLPYIVIQVVRDFDYDGLTVDLTFLAGFPDEAAAVIYAQRSAAEVCAVELARPSDGDYRWHIVEPVTSVLFPARSDSELVRRVSSERFKVANGSGYDSKYFEFEVIHVSATEPIGPELFEFLGSEAELTRHFLRCGESR